MNRIRDCKPWRWMRVLVLGGVAWIACLPAAAQFCVGDCNADRRVTANELVSILRSECPSLAAEQEQTIGAEIESAIANVFGGCATLPVDWEVAFDASETGYMMSGWGIGDGSLWVVGGQLLDGAILRYELGRWTQLELGFEVPLLNWVHGVSDADVFAGGNDGKILHFDGESWTEQETPVVDPVWGIWAVAPDDVWAVGGEPVFGTTPFVLHYDGRRWSHAPIPTIQRPGVAAFFKVWASGAEDVYAVGQNGVVLHWDGATFTELGVGISQDLIGIWGTGPTDITVVGGRGTAEIAHYDGTSWTRAPASSLGGLNGVWTRRGDVVHVVGVRGTALRVDPQTLEILGQDPVPTTLELHAIFGDESGHILAFGANFSIPEQGVVLIRELSDDD